MAVPRLLVYPFDYFNHLQQRNTKSTRALVTAAFPFDSDLAKVMLLAARRVIQADVRLLAVKAPRHERVVMRLDGSAQQRAVAGAANVEAAERQAVEANVVGVLDGVLVGLLLAVVSNDIATRKRSVH